VKPIYIVNHLGLGDHILCLGLYRHLASLYSTVIIPVRDHNLESMRLLLQDQSNIVYLPFPSSFAEESMQFFKVLARLLRYKLLELGHWGDNFMSSGMRFDQSFYAQAGVAFDERWSNFEYTRDLAMEIQLFKSYKVRPQEYVFLHEDSSRGFSVNRQYISSNLVVIEPKKGKDQVPISMYRYLMENAGELHLIESSFAAFCDSFPVQGTRFAHRYARPEAMRNSSYEFTYLNEWTIYTDSNSKKARDF
jgi:hypothetical protein